MKFSLTIPIPAATDVDGLLRCYGSLLSSMNIDNALGETNEAFSHPIESSRQTLLNSFNEHYHELNAITQNYSKVAVIGVTANERLILIELDAQ